MKDQIKWVLNTMPKSDDRQLSIMSLSNVAKARFFHSTFPQYSVTPLDRLDGMAQYLGLAGLCVKNESFRFGLNAFKVLGGSFAMAKYIASEMGRDVSEMTYDYLTSEAFRKEFGQATFFTATDGNHGRGVAWAANKLGQKAVVHMPKGSAKSRFDNIAKEGAKVTIEEVNYDDCVRMAAAEAAETEHGVIVQDTAWDGYEEIPSWIMEGYGTMASEAAEQYGPSRLALRIERLAQDFLLPSPTGEGVPLSRPALAEQLEERGGSVFFSHELCAHYFTYMTKTDGAHFVLFDDAGSIQKKCQLGARMGISHAFVPYAQVDDLLPGLLE